MIASLDYWVHQRWVQWGVNLFSDVAMTTSFLGVTLGLFDFIADGLKRSDQRSGRLQTALLTFIPPLIFAFIYPHGFVMALGYAGICVAFLEIILPALMVLRLRHHDTLRSSYQACQEWFVWLVLIVGLILITLAIIDVLPWSL